MKKTRAENPRIKALQRLGGITAVYENGFVVLCRGEWKMRVMKAEGIPLTYGGKATFMIQNVLPAILTANIEGMSIEDMKAGQETFIPSATQTPGRLNLFKFEKFSILLDYAHNAAEMFDEIIIRQDKRLRGKTEQELIKMLGDGIKTLCGLSITAPHAGYV